MERISPGDLVELATDVGPVPMNVGAVLVVDGGTDVGAAQIEAALAQRITTVPRLRQRLVTPPWGLGRPYWVDDPGFDVAAHVSRVRCPGAGDDDALLRIAVDAVTRPLSRARPLWRAVVITDLAGGRVALVMVLHHVLADGIGGLAMLARLVDGDGPTGTPDAPRPAPHALDLLRDSTRERVRGLRRAPSAVARLRGGRVELGRRDGDRRAPRCSWNAPTGPRRQVATVEVDLDAVRSAGRRHGATVNDVLLVALTAAMAGALGRRGEQVEELVVSVPVSARTSTTSADLGNRVGVMPVRVPVTGGLPERLSQVARSTRVRKTRTRGASAALVGPAFRLLAAVGLFRWVVDRQRLVNSFLTNLRGPAERLTLAGAPVLRVIPITGTAGNVGVAFAALSYAGTLVVSVIADPEVVPDPDTLAADLRAELERLTAV
ncbi:wax ester/triacylglycerol synthase domain-containing protein [uncultured Cellulomonas sp.]|uniref:wax ester/triacylglycerol synthase domain-containing protein n=1 Tax=uncultured Cellulomonas sp. TaxID=189682 RepID=UPI0028ECBC72|nr:wax ester/triacylglycerol synthase domain-containing protein [uncultured Cellulomonas sp.]